MSVTEPQKSDDGERIDEFKGRATAGAAWVGLGRGSQQILRLISNLILTRLLTEADFGLIAIVNVLLTGISLFSDIGIGAALIQNKRDDPGFVDTMWTLEIIRGVAVCLIGVAIAGPISAFYGEPILVDLIRIAALGSIVQAFSSTNLKLANRNLYMGRVVALQVGSQLSGLLVMVVWALIWPTVWALVAGGLAALAVSTIWSWMLPGPRNRLYFEVRAARSLYRFGRWILLSTLFNFLANQMDRLIFGKLVTMAVLGVYNIGINLALVPATVMTQMSFGIIFPVYSRFYHKGAPMLPIYRNARLPLLIFGGWATAGIVAGGPTIIELLYDPRYIEAGWMLQILAAGVWFGAALEGSNKVALIALGHTRWTATSGATKVVGMAALIPVGWYLGGFPGALLGLAASDVLRYVVSTIGVLQFGLDGRLQDFKMTSLVVVSASAAWYAVHLLQQAGWTNIVLHAFVIAAIVTAIWAPQHLKLWRRYRETGHVFFEEVS